MPWRMLFHQWAACGICHAAYAETGQPHIKRAQRGFSNYPYRTGSVGPPLILRAAEENRGWCTQCCAVPIPGAKTTCARKASFCALQHTQEPTAPCLGALAASLLIVAAMPPERPQSYYTGSWTSRAKLKNGARKSDASIHERTRSDTSARLTVVFGLDM